VGKALGKELDKVKAMWHDATRSPAGRPRGESRERRAADGQG
jgi:hypothetical protein